jgi:hypothetical protein
VAGEEVTAEDVMGAEEGVMSRTLAEELWVERHRQLRISRPTMERAARSAGMPDGRSIDSQCSKGIVG